MMMGQKQPYDSKDEAKVRDSKTVELLWVSERARNMGLARKICENMRIEQVDDPLDQSLCFWKRVGFKFMKQGPEGTFWSEVYKHLRTTSGIALLKEGSKSQETVMDERIESYEETKRIKARWMRYKQEEKVRVKSKLDKIETNKKRKRKRSQEKQIRKRK